MEASRLRTYLEDLQITVTMAGHVRVSGDWKHNDHITANNCLYYFLHGEGTLRIRDSAFIPKPGDLFILPAGAKISYSTSPDNPFSQMYCHFHAYVGQLPLFQIIDTPLHIRLNDQDRAQGLFNRLIQSFQSKSNLAPLAIKGAMFELLGFIWEQESRKPLPSVSPSQNRWNDILTYIEMRATEPISIPEIAAAFNYSPKYFFRYFKSTFGLTPHQYIVKVRMERAKHLLLTTDWTIAQIANELGMERAHFSRTFLSFVDMTPQRFRTLRRDELPK